jgi:UDP-N-acetylglucosamine--N-acetylmuramyl-(pentapeptide) pyrophosphoryl-undecaprenol N-acetylglucosamine transferase
MSDTLLIMAGGTGGHIMPGLAIARTMQSRGWMVRWLGTRHGMENKLVPAAGIRLDTVAFSGMRGKGPMHTLKGAALLALSLFRSARLMLQIKPTVVLGMGGYVTVPGGLAALLTGRRVVLVNADARLLLSNKVLAPFARQVLYGLPPARELKRRERFTGAPIREDILAIASPDSRFAGRSGALRVLVVGGSLGAAVLNRVVPEAIALLPVESRPQVIHQAGAQHIDQLGERYRSLGINATTLAFIDDMATQYANADLVICRAGAITVNELTCAGVASILVPLTVSTTSHQLDNARYMSKAGAARLLEQKNLNAENLSAMLGTLDRKALVEMANKARALGQRDAGNAVASALEATGRGAGAS